ncbi:hypothetical protein, partial [Segatella copri]|uniref:hypothetical protein n=1 Tax=Segatella copri TaxID=165179 RepID=UPI001D17085D
SCYCFFLNYARYKRGAAYKRVWQCVALGGNRNTAYCHALFTYNQRVKSKVTDVAIKTEKHFRIRIIKVGINFFLLYHSHVLAIVQKS